MTCLAIAVMASAHQADPLGCVLAGLLFEQPLRNAARCGAHHALVVLSPASLAVWAEQPTHDWPAAPCASSVHHSASNGTSAMPRTWTARDSEAILLPSCIGLAPRSATEGGCPTTTTRFALHLSSSYREMFDRDLAKCWRTRIVRVVSNSRRPLEQSGERKQRSTRTEAQLCRS
jgi:hypothetical protein